MHQFFTDFGLKQYVKDLLRSDGLSFMDETVAPALGISASAYDEQRNNVIQAFRSSFMLPATDKGRITSINIARCYRLLEPVDSVFYLVDYRPGSRRHRSHDRGGHDSKLNILSIILIYIFYLILKSSKF